MQNYLSDNRTAFCNTDFEAQLHEFDMADLIKECGFLERDDAIKRVSQSSLFYLGFASPDERDFCSELLKFFVHTMFDEEES